MLIQKHKDILKVMGYIVIRLLRLRNTGHRGEAVRKINHNQRVFKRLTAEFSAASICRIYNQNRW